jgi:uncharacterized protein HemX
MDYPIVNLLITAGVTALISGLVGYAFWLKKRERIAKDDIRRELDNVSKELSLLKEKADNLEDRLVEEQQVRKIAQSENSELKQEILEIKSSILSLTELMSELRIDLGVLNYIKERDRSRES